MEWRLQLLAGQMAMQSTRRADSRQTLGERGEFTQRRVAGWMVGIYAQLAGWFTARLAAQPDAAFASAKNNKPGTWPGLLGLQQGLLDLDRQAVVDLLLPDRRAGDMHRLALGVDRHGNRHVFHVELVDGFHAKFGEGHHARLLDSLGDQVGGTADGHQVHGLVVLDRLDGNRAALGLADHAQKASAFEDLPGELVHPRGGSRAGWADHFFAGRLPRRFPGRRTGPALPVRPGQCRRARSGRDGWRRSWGSCTPADWRRGSGNP